MANGATLRRGVRSAGLTAERRSAHALISPSKKSPTLDGVGISPATTTLTVNTPVTTNSRERQGQRLAGEQVPTKGGDERGRGGERADERQAGRTTSRR